MPWSEEITDRIREETHFGGRRLKCFAERPANVNALFAEAVQNHGSAEALVGGDSRLSFTALESEVAALAAGLCNNGIGAGERVAMLVGNRCEFVVVLLAVFRVGAIAVPVNIREQTPELAYILNHCGAALLIHDREIEPKLPAPEALDHLKIRYSIGGETALAKDYANLAAAAGTEYTAPVEEEQVAIILYTSGTTGLPKGAMLTHFNLVHSCMHFQYCMDLGAGERSLLVVPASHVTGVVAILLTMLRVAGCTVILPFFEAREVIEIISTENITHTVMVPAMYNLCLLRCKLDEYDLSAWRIGGFGGAPMPVPTIHALSKELPDLSLINAYGSTEATSPATVLPIATASLHTDSVGIAVPCADIRIVDENGQNLPDGEHGELWIGGPMMVPGYWNNPEKTRSEFDQGYWKSGDIGSRDEQGYIRLHDRRKDMIIRGGYNIYSAEIENVVTAIEGVIECAVIGRPDRVLGEKTEVIVYAQEMPITTELVIEYCSSHLADYKVPDYVTVVAEPLPRNANGKVIKTALRKHT
ncbi:O-succinylbenzoic acid--CoA ligase [Chromatiales bacterium (ex Bugula neritina AB1)]|nr:O-succinylbenzoic acid--CoA ligase [Chromatiales bacterium (ex Bugula neritina AB1)]